MQMNFMSVLGLSLLLLASACGGKSSSQSSSTKTEQVESLEGKYQVTFSALNSSISGMTSGVGTILIEGDHVKAEINLKDSPSHTVHAQYVYSGINCPTLLDDKNSDGFIDAVEGAAVYGSVLIPFDGDLNSQKLGFDEFPIANNLGNYLYVQEGSLADLVRDLEDIDPDEEDEMIKLAPDEKFKLHEKVLVIHGIHKDAYLPGSIRGKKSYSGRESLPIACGKILRIEEAPAVELEPSEATIDPRDVVGLF